jgi:hypothetical protein
VDMSVFGAKALVRQQGISATRTTLGIKAALGKVDSGNPSPDAGCDSARMHWLMNCFTKRKAMKRRHKVGWCIFGGTGVGAGLLTAFLLLWIHSLIGSRK